MVGSSLKSFFVAWSLATALIGQVTDEVTLGTGTYEGAGFAVIDEVTVAAQTLGADGFLGTFDDAIAVVRDLGGAPTVANVAMGVMTAGLIDLGGGMVATVTSGIDGQIGTLDDAILVLRDCHTGAPWKMIVPIGGTFVGGPTFVQHVETRDLIASAGPGRLLMTLAGGSVTSPPGDSDVVLLMDLNTTPVTRDYVVADAFLTRSPPTDLRLPGAVDELIVARSIGRDAMPTTSDDGIVVLNRETGTGSWSQRYQSMEGWGIVDGWQRVPRRFDADIGVMIASIVEGETPMGFSPESYRDNGLPRVSLGFVRLSGLSSSHGMLGLDITYIGEESRWIPPSPFVRYVSAFLPMQVGNPHSLVEFTDLGAPSPSRTWHVWPNSWSEDPELVFYGQATPVSGSVNSVLGTTASGGGGWGLFDQFGGRALPLNEGTIAQAGPSGIRWVENLLLGPQIGAVTHLQSDLVVDSARVASGGSVVALTYGADSTLGTSDDGVLFCSGLPGASHIGLGQPERPWGGPSLSLPDRLYPRAAATSILTFERDALIEGTPGSWRPGFLVATAQRSFSPFAWGRQFVSFSNPFELIMIDPFAGVGSTGRGTSQALLPGNGVFAGAELTLQWIVNNPQSPWSYDTSNGLVIRLGF